METEAPPEVCEHKAPPEKKRPRKDSNLRTRFRKPMLYPLSYGGESCRKGDPHRYGLQTNAACHRVGIKRRCCI